MDGTGDLVAAYTRYQEMRGLSPHSIRRRTVSITKFARFISPLALTDATTELVEDWLLSIPLATTRRAYRSDLSALYKFAVRRKITPSNPVEATDSVRIPTALPRPVNVDMVRPLIEFAPDQETRLAVGLAAYAGLRRSEVANLTRGDIVLGTTPPMLYVRHGKGNRDRAVPVHPELVELLRNLPAGRVCGHCSATIGDKVARYLRSMGVDATMHQLRHTFATEAARVSLDLLAVRDLLGHSTLSTTERYTKLTGERTSAAVAAMYT